MSKKLAALEAQIDGLRATGEWDDALRYTKNLKGTTYIHSGYISSVHNSNALMEAYRLTVQGDVAIQKHKYDDARKYLLRALAQTNTYVDALILLAEVNLSMGLWPSSSTSVTTHHHHHHHRHHHRGSVPAPLKMTFRKLHVPVVKLPKMRFPGSSLNVSTNTTVPPPLPPSVSDTNAPPSSSNPSLPTIDTTVNASSSSIPSSSSSTVGTTNTMNPPSSNSTIGLNFADTDSLELLLRAREYILQNIHTLTPYRLTLRLRGLSLLTILYEQGYSHHTYDTSPLTPTGTSTVSSPSSVSNAYLRINTLTIPSTIPSSSFLYNTSQSIISTSSLPSVPLNWSSTGLSLFSAIASCDLVWRILQIYVKEKFGINILSSNGTPYPNNPPSSTNNNEVSFPSINASYTDYSTVQVGDIITDEETNDKLYIIYRSESVLIGFILVYPDPALVSVPFTACIRGIKVRSALLSSIQLDNQANRSIDQSQKLLSDLPDIFATAFTNSFPSGKSGTSRGGSMPTGSGSNASSSTAAAAAAAASAALKGGNTTLLHRVDARSREEAIACLARLPFLIHKLGDVSTARSIYCACLNPTSQGLFVGTQLNDRWRSNLVRGLSALLTEGNSIGMLPRYKQSLPPWLVCLPASKPRIVPWNQLWNNFPVPDSTTLPTLTYNIPLNFGSVTSLFMSFSYLNHHLYALSERLIQINAPFPASIASTPSNSSSVLLAVAGSSSLNIHKLAEYASYTIDICRSILMIQPRNKLVMRTLVLALAIDILTQTPAYPLTGLEVERFPSIGNSTSTDFRSPSIESTMENDSMGWTNPSVTVLSLPRQRIAVSNTVVTRRTIDASTAMLTLLEESIGGSPSSSNSSSTVAKTKVRRGNKANKLPPSNASTYDDDGNDSSSSSSSSSSTSSSSDGQAEANHTKEGDHPYDSETGRSLSHPKASSGSLPKMQEYGPSIPETVLLIWVIRSLLLKLSNPGGAVTLATKALIAAGELTVNSASIIHSTKGRIRTTLNRPNHDAILANHPSSTVLSKPEDYSPTVHRWIQSQLIQSSYLLGLSLYVSVLTKTGAASTVSSTWGTVVSHHVPASSSGSIHPSSSDGRMLQRAATALRQCLQLDTDVSFRKLSIVTESVTENISIGTGGLPTPVLGSLSTVIDESIPVLDGTTNVRKLSDTSNGTTELVVVGGDEEGTRNETVVDGSSDVGSDYKNDQGTVDTSIYEGVEDNQGNGNSMNDQGNIDESTTDKGDEPDSDDTADGRLEPLGTGEPPIDGRLREETGGPGLDEIINDSVKVKQLQSLTNTLQTTSPNQWLSVYHLGLVYLQLGEVSLASVCSVHGLRLVHKHLETLGTNAWYSTTAKDTPTNDASASLLEADPLFYVRIGAALEPTAALVWALGVNIATITQTLRIAGLLCASGLQLFPNNLLLRLLEIRIVEELLAMDESSNNRTEDNVTIPTDSGTNEDDMVSPRSPVWMEGSVHVKGIVDQFGVLEAYRKVAANADILARQFLVHGSGIGWNGNAMAPSVSPNSFSASSSMFIPQPTLNIGLPDAKAEPSTPAPFTIRFAIGCHLHVLRIAASLGSYHLAYEALSLADSLVDTCGVPLRGNTLNTNSNSNSLSSSLAPSFTASVNKSLANSFASSSPNTPNPNSTNTTGSPFSSFVPSIRQYTVIDPTLRADILFGAGELHEVSGATGPAEAQYAAALAIAPNHIPSLLRLSFIACTTALALVYGYTDNPMLITTVLVRNPVMASISDIINQKALSLGPSTAGALKQDALDMLNRAESFVMRVLRLDESNAMAWSLYARILHARGSDTTIDKNSKVYEEATKAALKAITSRKERKLLLGLTMFPWCVPVWE